MEDGITKCFKMVYEHLIGKPFEKSSLELKYHKHGQGKRTVFMDSRVVPETSLYVIVRDLKKILEDKDSHVSVHSHNCDSTFLFLGKERNLTGLTCEITLGSEKYVVKSPASVFIPSGLKHSYRLINGSGYYINIVLSPDYNKSLK